MKPSKESSGVSVFINEDRLSPSESAEFLGVRLDGGLTWSDQIDKIEKRISSGLFVLRKTSKLNNENLSRIVYFSLIESHINYSIELWGGYKTHLDKIFVWQKKAIRAIFRLPPWAHCGDLFKKLGIMTVPSIYFFELVMYVRNQDLLNYGIRNHSYNTRHKASYSESHNLTIF